MMSLRNYGLIGKSLQHSFSAAYFAEKFAREGLTDCCYRLFPLDLDAGNVRGMVDSLVRQYLLRGFNVTNPYKCLVMNCLDVCDESACAIGAVNCVRVDWLNGEEGAFRLAGFNTDAPAFADVLRGKLRPGQVRALVLGTGGAARSVCFALKGLGIGSTMVSRCPERFAGGGLPYPVVSYESAYRMAGECGIVVNATPVGMFPKVDECPWMDMSLIGPTHLCMDLIYNPERSCFLQRCAQRGARVCNGLEMLHRQAELGWAIWND